MSETTEVKGQFGLGQSGGTGKKLKMFVLQMQKSASNLEFVNTFVHVHDLGCSCNKPTVHCLLMLCEQLRNELTTEEKQQIAKCLGITTTTDAAAATAQDIDFGEDLEKLFAEDITEEDG